MDSTFWQDRWNNNQIAFHSHHPEPLLITYYPALRQAMQHRPAPHVLVPLCGKSTDMMWLRAQGATVTGIELCRLAVEQFFAENRLTPVITRQGELECFSTDGLIVFAGNIADLTPDLLPPVHAVYDRAALVALPGDMRPAYAARTMALSRCAPQLLITCEYDQSLLSGPPFSVTSDDIQHCYGSVLDAEQLDRKEIPGGLKGRCPASDAAWLLTARA
ncbi:thiopurine S-methyltransferase [Acetobacter sp. AN02]|uniref:thiopurine S-methyltransferase n=1 Tax=Acetobacter sp. AN02 TaxID=2894186 RepID=UPI0024340E81|nr:thiopurine S-methyltransferase [Acetobacter sp. AN02]MDG6094727.1 thiopurine S-methyltransferase [Acetobacter sp. AN02]